MLSISSFKIRKILCSIIIILFAAESSHCTGFTRESLTTPDIKNDQFNFRSENQAVRYYSELMFNDDKAQGLNSVSETKPKRKSPELAFMMAFGPGFFIHGMGHFYIGSYGKAAGMLGIEVFSLALAFAATMNDIVGDDEDKCDNRKYNLNAAAFVLFLGSWAWDMIGAPLKAKRMNDKMSLSIRPEIKSKQMSLNVALNWK